MSLSLRIPSLRHVQEIVTLLPNSIDDDSVAASVAASKVEVDDNTCKNKTNETIPCYICNIRPSQYTCPKCHIPYCSVNCYRTHGATSSSSDNDGTTMGAFTCIENFYEQRVSQIIQLEVKEQSQQFMRQQQISLENLNVSNDDSQIHTDLKRDTNSGSQNTSIKCVLRNDNAITASAPLSREELIQIWSILEQIEERRKFSYPDDEDDITILQQRLQQHCSIRVQNAIEQAVQNLTSTVNLPDDEMTSTIPHNNERITEWILEPWSPWWCRNFTPIGHQGHELEVPSDDDTDNDMDGSGHAVDDSNTTATLKGDVTLDERLLSVPRFDTLYRTTSCINGGNSNLRLPQFPQLQYNLIDILFATAYTLRTFHGVKNIGNDVAIDAATTLIHSSLVLLKDQRYTSIESVLMECCDVNHPLHQQIQFYNNGKICGQTPSSDTVFQMLQDVALLYQNHRYVARALLEANDILQQAIIELKQASKGMTNPKRSTQRDINIGPGNIDIRNHLRRVHKKIVFYLSWTITVSMVKTSVVQRRWPYSHFSSDIQVWIEGWQLPSKAKAPSIKI